MAQDCVGKSKACTLGPIIHNPQMVKKLADQGVGMVNYLSEVPGDTVIIRSHGVGPDIYQQASEKNLCVVDATCPHVKKAQQAACNMAQNGYTVVVVGERYHPEVKSIVEWAGKEAMVVETVQEAMAIAFTDKLGIVAQTTFADDAFQNIIEVLNTKCLEMQVARTICTATELRQQAAIELAGRVDVIVVIGGKNSANTTRLAQLCRNAGSKVYHIETAQELEQVWFVGIKTVGITAGASTPDWLIEEAYQKMQEFDQVINQEIIRLETGSIIKGKVVSIRKDEVFIDVGHKAEAIIPLVELAYPIPDNAADVVSEGQIIDVYVIDADASDGSIKLSKVKADKIVSWDKLEDDFANRQSIEGNVIEAVKGGLVISVYGIRGFIPASQVDLRFVENLTDFVGQSLRVLPIEVDRTKERIVLSRKVLLEEQRQLRQEEIFSSIAVNQVLIGTVRRITDFGAFVDIGGIDGLLHISDISWQRIKSPLEVVSVGDEVKVMVIKVDTPAKKISLSLKQVERDPWLDTVTQFSEGMIITGKVTKIVKFGAFVDIGKGVEGLVHVSEMAEHRIANAQEIVSEGQVIQVKILTIDIKNKRIALSMNEARQDAERAEYQEYLDDQSSSGGMTTIGDKLGHLFKRED
jgi:4-hydroxy-3-methylbut-2-enyl diphosphate reductase